MDAAWFGPRRPPAFCDVRELQAWAGRRGLHCRSDSKDGKVTRSLAVSIRPLTWEEAACAVRYRRGNLPGVLWAINWSPSLKLPPGGAACRVWGQVLVTGDPHLLDRLERDDP
jgi:hypothetical protein